MLRLNVFYPPAKKPNVFGLLGGDVAGFPNGRRVFDDVTTIELQALAGATLPLVNSLFTPKHHYTADAAAGLVNQGLVKSGTDTTANGTEVYIKAFPYLGNPWSGAKVGPNTASRPEMAVPTPAISRRDVSSEDAAPSPASPRPRAGGASRT